MAFEGSHLGALMDYFNYSDIEEFVDVWQALEIDFRYEVIREIFR